MKIDYIERAQEALKIHSFRRTQVPELVLHILKEEEWKSRNPDPQELKQKEFSFFPEFVEATRPWGLQIDYKELELLCKGFEDVELALAKEKSQKGKVVNVQELKNIKKTEKQKHLEILEKEKPELLKKVLNKELTVYAAMIEAGLKKERAKVEKTPEGFATYIKEHFSKKQKEIILKLLQTK